MEIICCIRSKDKLQDVEYHDDVQVRWLDAERDYKTFLTHLQERNPQEQFSRERWRKLSEDSITYCGLFKEGIMIARAAVERYSNDMWETADVRVFPKERGKGYAKQICHYVTDYILSSEKCATCRTEHDDFSMQRVIHTLGFKKCDE